MRAAKLIALAPLVGALACSEYEVKDTGVQKETSTQMSAYECETNLSTAEALPNYALVLKDAALVDGAIEAIIQGNPEQELDCYVYPSIGNGWNADVSFNELTGAPDTVSIAFEWDPSVERIEVWCVAQESDCNEFIQFQVPTIESNDTGTQDDYETVDYLAFSQ